jgi:GAG-pre-integrase domain/Integrase core domain
MTCWVIAQAKLVNSLYILTVLILNAEKAKISTVSNNDLPIATVAQASNSLKATLNMWHYRLGHINTNYVLRMVKNSMVNGMSIVPDMKEKTDAICSACLHGKQTWKLIPSETKTHATEVLGQVYSDICGPMSTQGQEGHQYYMTIMDDHSCYSWVFFLKHKNEAFMHFKEWLAWAENKSSKCLKQFHNDGGGEYVSSEFLKFLRDRGIHWENTNTNTPQENGVSECLNWTLNNAATLMLEDTELWLGKSFWIYAVKHVTLIKNCLPTWALPPDVTPYEVYHGKKPSGTLLHIFGCKAWVHIPEHLQGKFGSKSHPCIYLRYAENKKAFLLYHIESRKLVESCNVDVEEELGKSDHVTIEVPDGVGKDKETADSGGRMLGRILILI